MKIFKVPQPTAQPTATHPGDLGIEDADHFSIHTVPDWATRQIPSSSSLSAPLPTPTKTKDTAATASTPPPVTLSQATVTNFRRAAGDDGRAAARQPTSAADSPKKKQKTTSVAESVVQPNANAKTAPKAKPMDKTASKLKAKTPKKPKAIAKTGLKSKAKAKSVLKPKAKAKSLLKAKAKMAPKAIMPSEPAGRMFHPIKWGPVTIYHGGKQRKYRLKEYTGSRRTRSFSDWQTMMRYIRTL